MSGTTKRLIEEGARLAKELEAAVSAIDEPRLRMAALQYPLAGGKAVRPVLAVLACEAAGGRASDADPLAISVELLHTFSLVHDDVMDEDDLRRGVQTVHKAFDVPTAILAGDALFALAFEVLARLRPGPASQAILLDVAATARVLCEGQADDMAFEARWPNVAEYERMIAKKTAALFACATANAARVAGAPEVTVQALHGFGWHLGHGFQVQDDVLGLTMPTEKLRKPRGSDILAGKKTYPFILARSRASPRDAEHLERVLDGSATMKDVDWAVELARTTGAIDAGKARAGELFAAARKDLMRLKASPARDELADLLEYVERRER